MSIPSEWQNVVVQDIQDSIAVKRALLEDEHLLGSIMEMADVVGSSLQRGNKVMFCGNGGSFADSQHLAAEFVSRFMIERKPLAALALGTNNSILSAVGNDYSYDQVFVRELKAVAQKGDVLIAISTSGNSINVIRVVEEAQSMGLHVFGLTGETGGKLGSVISCLKIPSKSTGRIQESHIMIGHILCHFIDKMVTEGRIK